jgi:3-dehydroquinate synthetase
VLFRSRVLARWNLPLRDPALDPARLAEGLSKDKKNANGRLRFVDMDGPGRPRIRELDAQGVQELLERASRTWRAAGAAAGGKA